MTAALIQGFLSGWLGRLIIGGLAVITSVRYGTGIYVWRETEKLERPAYKVLMKLSDGVEIRQYEPYLIAETTVDGTGFKQPTSDGFRACAGYIFGKNKPRRRTSKSNNDDGEKMAMTAPVRVSGDSPSSSSSASASMVGEKMAMTAPVRIDGGGGGMSKKKKKTKVSFVIGSKYSLQSAPKPMNKNVKLRQVPGHVLAVKTFSGPPPTDERVVRERQKIEVALQKKVLEKEQNDDTDKKDENNMDINIIPISDETLVYGYHDPFITPNFLRRNEVALLIGGRLQ